MAQLKYNLDEISNITVEPGRYRARLTKCEQTLSTTKNPMLVWHWKIVSGDEKSKEIRSFTSLLDNALGTLKNHLEAFGFTGKVNLDTGKLIGRYATIVVALREGKTREGVDAEFSNVVAVLPDTRKKKKRKPVEEEYEDEYEDEEEEEEDENEDEDEYEDEEDEDEYEDEEEEEYEDDEEEEEEPPPPKRRRPVAKKRPAKKKKKKKDLPF